MSNDLVIRSMIRSEVDDLVEWAAREGWNPGLHDAGIFWRTDPDAHLAAELVGGGATTSYDGRFGFMGLFIMRPEFRGRGLGDHLWHARLGLLRDRLEPGASIGMDGVFAMQHYYAEGGFEFSHRNLRFEADIPPAATSAAVDPHVVPLSTVALDDVLAYDRRCFPAPRRTFVEAWISQPDAMAVGYVDDVLRGYGVARRCRSGSKFGPLFADDGDVAEALFTALSGFAAGGPAFLDAPENQPAAMELVERHRMREVFGCARMYVGDAPDIDDARVFGVTTFELG